MHYAAGLSEFIYVQWGLWTLLYADLKSNFKIFFSAIAYRTGVLQKIQISLNTTLQLNVILHGEYLQKHR